MKKVTKILTLVCFSLGVIALVGCGGKKTKNNNTNAKTNATSKTQAVVDRNEITIDFLSGETGSIALDTTPVVVSGRTAPTAGATYTYNVAANSLPTAWNIHTYQSNDATLVLDYTEDALYTFDYNSTLDGYRIVPSMANGPVVDVTAQFAGDKWNIKADETNRAYKITLRNDLKFDNGAQIKAADIIESTKLLLNPKAANYRADSLYSGSLKITNAKNYFLGGTYGFGEFVSENYGDDEYVYPEDWEHDENGFIVINGKDLWIDITDGGNWGSNSLLDYADAGYFGDPRTYVTVGEGDDALVFVKYADAEGELVVYRDAEAHEETDAETGETVEVFNWYVVESEDDLGTDAATVAVVVEKTDGYYYKETADAEDETLIAWKNCVTYPEPFASLYNAADESGKVHLNDTLAKAAQDCIAVLQGFEDVDAYAANPDTGDYAYVEFEEMAKLAQQYDEFSWDNVGILPVDGDEYSFIIILDKALSGFYLYYNLASSFYLVDTELYNSCTKTEAGVYSNSYGTSVSTYRSFGPYKLVSFIDGSEIKLEKNEHWYGYALEENATNYWTTNINILQVSSDAARLEMFLKGQTDSYGLQEADMDDYQSSKYTYFTDGDSTWFIAFNPNESALKGVEDKAQPATAGNKVVKRVLTLKEFRQALSFSVDRKAYALALDPLGGTAKALYGNMIISDPDNGVAYRTTDQAKDVILKFWGLYEEVVECGFEDGLYETRDEAIATITGYDPTGAKNLFKVAYDNAVLAGIIPEGDKWEVQIVVGQPGSGSSAYYNNGYEFLKQVWTNAVVGTPFEGHLVFSQSQPLGSTNFSDYLKDNSIDLLFGVGWTGSTLDPYGLMEAYVAPNYQYDPAWDTTKESCDIVIDGYTLRASVYDWGALALNGEEIKAYVVEDGKLNGDYCFISCGTECKANIRLDVLAAVEGKVLEQYDMIPVNLDSSANLKGMKIKYGTEEYVFGMGRGGIKYMTYNYTDAEWTQFVTDQGGTLNYKVSK